MRAWKLLYQHVKKAGWHNPSKIIFLCINNLFIPQYTTHTHTHTHIHTHTYIQKLTHLHTHTHTHTHTHIHTHTYIHKLTHLHTHTHTNTYCDTLTHISSGVVAVSVRVSSTSGVHTLTVHCVSLCITHCWEEERAERWRLLDQLCGIWWAEKWEGSSTLLSIFFSNSSEPTQASSHHC